MKKDNILITKYLPANYEDCFTDIIKDKPLISSKELFNLIFVQYPKWILFFLKLRDLIVKPLGLQTNKSFEDIILEQCNNEIILGTEDKHLTFYVSLFCSDINNGKQTISISTVVKYKNILGRLYFATIWLFHRIIVHYLFKRAIKKLNKYNTKELFDRK